MLNSTMHSTYSGKVILTEDEEAFFAKTTDEDLFKISESLKSTRENINAVEQHGGFDHYKNVQGPQHINYPAYDDPFEDTPFRIGCRLLAEIVSKHVTDKNALLLDAGAGSGYLAAEAIKLGFKNIDCLEPSQGMIDKQPKGLFGKVYKEIISLSEPCSIKTESYDCVMSNGSVVAGHIEVKDFPEVFRIVKPGGYVFFNISDFWYKYTDFGARLDTTFQTDLESGKLEKVVKERRAYIYPIEDATIYVLQKAV